MRNEKVYQGIIPSTTHDVENIIQSVIEKFKRWNVEEVPLSEVEFILTELLMNAIEHGNCFDEAKYIYIYAAVKDGQWICRVTDQGDGFDGRVTLKQEENKLTEYQSRGRGLYLVSQMVQEMKFKNEGRTLEVIKYLDFDKNDFNEQANS